VNLRFIDWIWHVRGSLTLAPEQSSDDAFNRLDSLFRQTGTSHERTNDTLIFRKKDQAAAVEKVTQLHQRFTVLQRWLATLRELQFQLEN